jgi:hypothetical protein
LARVNCHHNDLIEDSKPFSQYTHLSLVSQIRRSSKDGYGIAQTSLMLSKDAQQRIRLHAETTRVFAFLIRSFRMQYQLPTVFLSSAMSSSILFRADLETPATPNTCTLLKLCCIFSRGRSNLLKSVKYD